jgi:hypothetical protein
MDRRQFLQAGAVGAAIPPPYRPTAQLRKALMKAGTQHSTSDDVLRVMAALGVHHICSTLPSAKLDENWSVEGLTRLRERVESYGIRLNTARWSEPSGVFGAS